MEIMDTIVVVLCLAAGTFAADDDGPVSSEFSRAATKFSVDLLKVLSEEAGNNNLVMSPTSLSTLLAMVQSGSEGTTQEELIKALYASPSESEEGYSRLTRNLKVKTGQSILEFANGAFVNAKYEIEPAFNETLVQSFQSSIEALNFANPMGSANRINAWAAERTHNRIKKLIPAETLDPLTLLVLVNAIYFKDLWQIPFRKIDTRNENFYLSKNNTIRVPTMKLYKERFKIGNIPEIGAKWVALPFKSGRFIMLVMYPDKVDGLSNLVQSLTGDTVADIIESLNKTGATLINLSIPKFKLESNLNLKEPLQKLGIKEIFNNAAQLKGITKEPVYVSKILQKAEIEVDEKGATASAATAIRIGVGTSSLPRQPVDVIVDRPSLVFLLDMTNNLPIFTSKLFNPSRPSGILKWLEITLQLFRNLVGL